MTLGRDKEFLDLETRIAELESEIELRDKKIEALKDDLFDMIKGLVRISEVVSEVKRATIDP